MSDTNSGFDPTASSLAGVAPEVLAELFSVRSSIDNIDATLVYLLAERFKATQRVGHLKAEHRLPPGDPDREAAQIARLRALAEEAHLDPAFAEKFLNFIISEVIRHHQAISDTRNARDAPADPSSSDSDTDGTAGGNPGAGGADVHSGGHREG
ncbi:chorismate mutase [Arthrobacter sp. H41]|uniref:chorismate mutase n=1 Tax=Arthrobacter sp. H41 TaxID=1312978 RepID=UPI0004BAEDC5|nr:chorismate mutase [Arthrobacter sp. H41]